MNPSQEISIYASCPPGLEPALAEELRSLRIRFNPNFDNSEKINVEGEEPGGVEFKGTLEDVFRCNLHLRVASRVVVRLGHFMLRLSVSYAKKPAVSPGNNLSHPVKISISK